MQQQQQCDRSDARCERGDAMHATTGKLPPIHDASSSSMLPRLVPSARVPTPPTDARRHDLGSLSRLPGPQQRSLIPPPAVSSSLSLLKFPSLVKPQHRVAPLVDVSTCNQESEQGSSASKSQQQRSHRRGNNDNDDDSDDRASRSSLPSAGAGRSAAAVADKNRDFIRELEEKKRKEREDDARKQRRKQKLHAKLSRKILEEAALARQKQQSDPEQPDAATTELQDGDDQQQQPQDDERESADAQQRREKARRQKRLLKKQQALLEQLQCKKKEKQEELEQERAKERRRQESVKRAVLTAIYDARCQEDNGEDDGGYSDDACSEHGSEHVAPATSASVDGSPLAAAPAAGQQRIHEHDTLTTPSPPPPQDDNDGADSVDEQQQQQTQQRAKEQRDALQRKQQAYLAKLAEQRKQKAKEEEDARALQAKRKKKLQQEALLRHQEVAKAQQEAAAAAAAAAAQREREEIAEREANASAVDVDAMVARLSKLKDRDTHVVPEARDFASWKKRHGVRPDQRVFSVTGSYPVIREELEQRGWFFNADRSSPFFDLKWALKSDDLKTSKLAKHQYVNHFSQNTAITTKVGLLHNLRSLVWHQSRDIDTIFPRAYDLNEPRDMESFIQDFRYGVAEGLLKELAKRCSDSSAAAVRANVGVVDVLLSVARKKVKSKRPDDSDALDESIDCAVALSSEELVTDLEWEVLSKCRVDQPGSLRASLVYKKKVFADDRSDAALALDSGGASAAPSSAPSVDTVLSALEKKQQRLIEKQRTEAFSREKARVAQLLSRVDALDAGGMAEIVRLTTALEQLCPQFRINGGWSRSTDAPVRHAELLPSASLNIWIVKPAGMSRGRGIRVFNDLDLLLAYADVENHKECQWVAQKYIENPLLVCARKFDIRQWVLVTSWDPLTVWFYRDCYLRFSSEPYSLDDLSDQYVHLTNNSIQKYSDKFHDVYATDDGAIAVEGNMLHSDAFQQYLTSVLGKPAAFWEDELQRRMKDIVVGSLQCVQDLVQHRPNCCELFGYDFMLDTDLTPWLIEVNSSPACDYSTPTAERYVKTGLADIVKVIVDHREYEQKKKSGGASGTSEPDTGCWQRIHKGEFIGKPVSSFGADFFVKGAKVAKTKRGGRAPVASSSSSARTMNTAGARSDDTSLNAHNASDGGRTIVEEDDEDGDAASDDAEEAEDLPQDSDSDSNDDAAIGAVAHEVLVASRNDASEDERDGSAPSDDENGSDVDPLL